MNIEDIKQTLINEFGNNTELQKVISLFPADLYEKRYTPEYQQKYGMYAKYINYLGRINFHLPQLDWLVPATRDLSALDIGGGPGYLSYICKYIGYRTAIVLNMPEEHPINTLEMIRKAIGVKCVYHTVRAWQPLPVMEEEPFSLISATQMVFDFSWGAAEWEFFLADLCKRMTSEGIIYLYFNPDQRARIWADKSFLNFFLSRGALEIVPGRALIFNDLSQLRISLGHTTAGQYQGLPLKASRTGTPVDKPAEAMPTPQVFANVDSLQDFLRALPQDRFVVGLFINSTELAQDEWMNPLAAHLRKAGYVTIGLPTPVAAGKCDLGNAEYMAVINPADLSALGRINVFIILDVDACHSFPQESKVCGCCHGFAIAGDTAIPWHTHEPCYLDAWLCSYPLTAKTRELTQALWQNMVNPAFSWRKGKDFYIIPQGYPRMAALTETLANNRQKRDAIIYAPVLMSYLPDMGGNRVEIYGAQIIGALLDNFPAHKVIFRPYSADLGSPVIKKLCDTFVNEPRFMLDANRDKAFSFARGAALVTDFSHIAGSFAFTTFHPAFFYKPWEKNQPDFQKIPGGGITRSMDALIKAITAGLERNEETERIIRRDRDRFAMPVENAFSEITAMLPDLFQDHPRESWLRIGRTGSGSLSQQSEIIRRVQNQPEKLRFYIGAALLLSHNTKSPLLAAYALHKGKEEVPAGKTWPEFYVYTGKLVGKAIERVPNSEIDPEIIRTLYALALAACEADANLPAQDLVKELLSDFNRLFPKNETPDAEPDARLETAQIGGGGGKPGRKQAQPGLDGFGQHVLQDRTSLKNFLRGLPSDKFVAAIWIAHNYVSQDEWLNQLAIHLRKAGYITLGLVFSACAHKCNLCNTEHLAITESGDLEELDRINVFICIDLDALQAKFPQKSRVLGCCHSFRYAADTAFPNGSWWPGFMDGYLNPFALSQKTRNLTQSLWQQLVNRKFSQRKAQNFYIIPAGYPRMAALSELLARSGAKHDSIIYAPAQIHLSPTLGGNRVEVYGTALIQRLLEEFPDFNIIFRPFQQDLNALTIKKLCQTFADEPRFIFDGNPGRESSFARGVAIITDLSHVGASFAFTTLRPAFYYKPWESENPHFSSCPGGYTAWTLTGLTEALRASLSQSQETAERIRTERDRLAMPVENTLEDIAAMLPDFFYDRPRPEWLETKRDGDGSLPGQVDLIQRIQPYDPFNKYELATSILRLFNPDSPLLAAYALHTGMQSALNYFPWTNVHAIAGNILGKNIPQVLFEKTDPEDVRALYSLARKEAVCEGNEEALALVEKLLEDFNTHSPEHVLNF